MTNKTKKVISKREKLFLNWLARPVTKLVTTNGTVKLVPPNPKDIGVDGYKYHDEILEDYKPVGGSNENF